MPPILFNGDCNFLFASDYSGGAGRYTARVIDDYVDLLARSGVNTYFINVNAQAPWYPSRRLPTVLSGYRRGDVEHVLPYFPPLGADFTAAQRQALVERQVRMLDRYVDLVEQGVDWLARACARCRERGLSPWASVRMNDAHGANNWEGCYFNCPPQRDPRMRLPMTHLDPARGPHRSHQVCDYRHPEVRDYYLEMIRELVTDYDVDGVEMDWVRMPLCLAPDADEAGIDLMTDWAGRVREVCGGRKLGARVPVKLDEMRTLGLDIAAWCQRGLLDYVAPTNFFQTAWETPFAQLRRRLGGGVRIHGVIEGAPNWLDGREGSGASARRFVSVSAALIHGAAAAHLAHGADGLYFYNFFCADAQADRSGAARRVARYDALAPCVDLDHLRGREKHYTLATAFNYWSPRFTEYAPQLPAMIERGLWKTFSIPMAAEPAGAGLELVAQLVIDRPPGDAPRLGVSLNGRWPVFDAQLSDTPPLPTGGFVRHAPEHVGLDFRLPVAALRDGVNELTVYDSDPDCSPVSNRDRAHVRVASVELVVRKIQR